MNLRLLKHPVMMMRVNKNVFVEDVDVCMRRRQKNLKFGLNVACVANGITVSVKSFHVLLQVKLCISV